MAASPGAGADVIFLLACSPPVDPCAVLKAPAPGPLADERSRTKDPVAIARVFVREARLAGDPGFYTLAEQALECSIAEKPTHAARQLRAHVWLQFHRFADAEREAEALTTEPEAAWLDFAFLGDARMEQGRLDAAADAYQAAMDRRPGLEMYDRVAWLRWLWGDVDGALELQRMAVSAGGPTDPEPYAWVLTRLGWLHALRNEPAPEIEEALALLPNYPPARLARGRIRLLTGGDAASDLRVVGPTVEATWALSEVDPSASVESVKTQDPRGYAQWVSDRDPAKALAPLDEEWDQRQDAVTRMSRAYAAFRAKAAGVPVDVDPATEARAALETGIVEPRVLRMGSAILGDPALCERALAMGPGLLPSERKACGG